MTDRDKAENLWQTLNALKLIYKRHILNDETIKDIDNALKNNRPNSEETQIDQDKQFAQLVYNELPLSSEIPLVNRLITMCKKRLNITDNDN